MQTAFFHSKNKKQKHKIHSILISFVYFTFSVNMISKYNLHSKFNKF